MVMWGLKSISPKKRAPRNAKNKRSRPELPVKVGEEYELDIIDVSPNGEGIAKVDGYPVFISGAKPGQHVKAKICRLDSVSADAQIAYQSG